MNYSQRNNRSFLRELSKKWSSIIIITPIIIIITGLEDTGHKEPSINSIIPTNSIIGSSLLRRVAVVTVTPIAGDQHRPHLITSEEPIPLTTTLRLRSKLTFRPKNLLLNTLKNLKAQRKQMIVVSLKMIPP